MDKKINVPTNEKKISIPLELIGLREKIRDSDLSLEIEKLVDDVWKRRWRLKINK